MSLKTIQRITCDADTCGYSCECGTQREVTAMLERAAWVSNEFGDFCSELCWDRYKHANEIGE